MTSGNTTVLAQFFDVHTRFSEAHRLMLTSNQAYPYDCDAVMYANQLSELYEQLSPTEKALADALDSLSGNRQWEVF